MSSRLEDPAGIADRLLVERHRSGDAAAFAELYERHYPRLVRFVHRHIAQRHIAEEMAQEAFARALAAVDTLRDPSRFYPWLTVIARHLVVRHHRVTARLFLIADMDGGMGEHDAPDSRLLRQLDEEDVQKALARVRNRHREILELREQDELSYEDIAVRLGTPTTTVPPLLFRARQALRREYLAVVEGDDKRLPVLVPAMLAGVRRVRARLAQATGTLPDSVVFAGTATVAASLTLGMASFFGVAIAPNAEAGGALAGPAMAVPAYLVAGERRSDADSSGAFPTPSPQGHLSASSAVVISSEVGEVGVNDPDGAEETRDRVQDWPIVLDSGPVGSAVNPEPLWEDLGFVSE